MYNERTTEPLKQGIERFTNSQSGRFITNERTEQVYDPETQEERTEYVYDVYPLTDCRQSNRVKNDVITEEHPFGDETKILRKTLAKILKASNQYDSEEYAEFRTYNEFCEGI